MAKSPVRRSSTAAKKKIDSLTARIEALEDQSFAQRLLIDELESKIEQMEKTVKDVRENPFQMSWPTIPPQQQYSGGHTCFPGHADMLGNTVCTICGALMSTGVTISNTVTYGDTSGTYAADDIEIVWDAGEFTKKE